MNSAAPNSLTEADVLAALRDCYDPELPVNLVDLGLIYRVAITPDTDAPGAGIPGVPPRHTVEIDMTLTSTGCPAHEQITAQIENRLAGIFAISKTKVNIVWEPKWGPERLTPAARQQLGI
jgi:metal-sulfur cluster biosynthetic enzyme